MSQFTDDGDDLAMMQIANMLVTHAQQRKQIQEAAAKAALAKAERRRFGWRARLGRWLQSL